MIDVSSPTFVSILLYCIYVLLFLGVASLIWSMVRSFRRNRGEAVCNGLPVRRIAWSIVLLVVLALGLTCLLASTEPLPINGKTFDNALWLRVSDMLISTSLILMLVAVVGVLFGISGLSRKLKN